VAEHLFLVGMMGSGKSTVGRIVADTLGWAFVDTDAEVESATGATVEGVFIGRGEGGFRAEERRAVEAAGRHPGPVVVSVGGGAVLDERNCAVMRAGVGVVWLRARAETLARRVGTASGRPLLAEPGAPGALAVLERIESERRERYRDVATAVVDVDDLTPVEAAAAVVAASAVVP
jgi:shikimate kinase